MRYFILRQVGVHGVSSRNIFHRYRPFDAAFYAWRDAGLFEAMNTMLVMNLREIQGSEASLSAGVILTARFRAMTQAGGSKGTSDIS